MLFLDGKKNINEGGYALSELLVAMALFSLIIGAIYSFYYSTSRSWEMNYKLSNVRQNYFQALNDMKEKLRETRPIANESAFIYADKNKIAFYCNVDTDPELEKVEYSVEANNLLRRVYEPLLQGSSYNYNTTPKTDVLVSGCLNSNQNPLFQFKDINGNLLNNFPLNQTDRGLVKVVKISLILNYGTDLEIKTLSIDSEVWLRNVPKNE